MRQHSCCSRRRLSYIKLENYLETLKNIVKLGSLAPSRMNRQPWQFIIINKKTIKDLIFVNILWGSKNPTNKIFSKADHAPNSYVAILIDERIAKTGYEYEIGACAENMMIYARGLGIGSVWIHSINRDSITNLLKIPKEIKLDSIIAFGYPSHISKTIDMDNGFNYSTDSKNNLCVPKRKIEKITFYNSYGDN